MMGCRGLDARLLLLFAALCTGFLWCSFLNGFSRGDGCLFVRKLDVVSVGYDIFKARHACL